MSRSPSTTVSSTVTKPTRGSPASSTSSKIGHSRRNLRAVSRLNPPHATEAPMADQWPDSKANRKALIGAGVAVAAAGTAAAFLFARRTGSSGAPVENISDAPDHVWRRGTEHYDENLLGNTVTVGRAPQELYEEWRDFS